MNRLDYIDVLRATAFQVDLDPDNLAPRDFAMLRTLHSGRLRLIWQDQEWPELCPDPEQRYFRDLYDSASGYVATNEVFYQGPSQYYQALKTVPVGQAPATYSGTSWSTNLAYWALAEFSHSAREYVNTTAYVQGDKVFYTPTGHYYQLHAASSTGNLPTDITKWGVLTPFLKYVAFEQEGETPFDHAFRGWDHNPELSGRARQLTIWTSAQGVQTVEAVQWLWLEFRRRVPQLTGDAYSATATYAAGQQIYYSSTAVRGNFYICVSATSAGETPESAAAKWALVELPAAFSNYLIHGAAGDYLRPGDPVSASSQAGLAETALEHERLVWAGQIARRTRPNVRTR